MKRIRQIGLALSLLLLAASRLEAQAFADMAVKKTDSPDPVVAGSTITYTITVTNNGPDSTSVELDDPIPSSTTFVSFTSPAG